MTFFQASASIIWGRFVFAFLFLAGSNGFAPAPIRWGWLESSIFCTATKNSVANTVVKPLLGLELRARGGAMHAGEALCFIANADNTITLHGTGLCIEASGNEVRANRCNGGPNQLWKWFPWAGAIQLKGSNKCLDISGQGGFDGAPIELHECENEVAATWRRNDSNPLLIPPKISFSMRYSASFISMAMILALGVAASLWLWPTRNRLVPHSSGPLRFDDGGLCLTGPIVEQHSNYIIPGVMALDAENGKENKHLMLKAADSKSGVVTFVREDPVGAVVPGCQSGALSEVAIRTLKNEKFVTIENYIDDEFVKKLLEDINGLRELHGCRRFRHHEYFDLGGIAAGRLCELFANMQRSIEDGVGTSFVLTDLYYCYYPAPELLADGSRDSKGGIPAHLDATLSNPLFDYTFVLYLNPQWKESDEGYLRVYDGDGRRPEVVLKRSRLYEDVAPTAAKLVVFKSDEVMHEVRPTNAQRVSIGGWFSRVIDSKDRADPGGMVSSMVEATWSDPGVEATW